MIIIHLVYLPARPLPLAEAVPGNEGDYPCILASPSFAINPKGLVRGVGMVEAQFENRLPS